MYSKRPFFSSGLLEVVMTKEEIDNKYLKLHDDLEREFFDIVDEGLPSQHRMLKLGKSIEEFNLRHSEIWRDHEAELVTQGFIEPLERIYRYEAFSKEIIHPKREKPIYTNYEVLEFNEELTTEELSTLEGELKKAVRKIGESYRPRR